MRKRRITKAMILDFLDGMLSVWDITGTMPDVHQAEQAADRQRARRSKEQS